MLAVISCEGGCWPAVPVRTAYHQGRTASSRGGCPPFAAAHRPIRRQLILTLSHPAEPRVFGRPAPTRCCPVAQAAQHHPQRPGSRAAAHRPHSARPSQTPYGAHCARPAPRVCLGDQPCCRAASHHSVGALSYRGHAWPPSSRRGSQSCLAGGA